MKVYAFDLMPWPYLDEPSYYPDANALFDPVRGQEIYRYDPATGEGVFAS